VSARGRLDDRRLRDVLLVALTVSTGSVDAVSWFGLGKVFSAFMTGNFAFLGFRAAGVPGPSVPRVVASLVAFGIGAFVAARIVEPTRDSGTVWPRRVTVALGGVVAAQVAFLTVWVGVDGHPSSGVGHLLIAISALAMGMQTSAVFSLGVRAVFTTATTATWAVLMGDLSRSSSSSGETRRLAAVIVGLFVGAVAGAFLFAHARVWAPVLPLAVSSLVVAVAAFAPRARELTVPPGVTVRSDSPDGQSFPGR
jgi:uncharacterized membrane protein YoaK (UPF0700 family)